MPAFFCEIFNQLKHCEVVFVNGDANGNGTSEPERHTSVQPYQKGIVCV